MSCNRALGVPTIGGDTVFFQKLSDGYVLIAIGTFQYRVHYEDLAEMMSEMKSLEERK